MAPRFRLGPNQRREAAADKRLGQSRKVWPKPVVSSDSTERDRVTVLDADCGIFGTERFQGAGTAEGIADLPIAAWACRAPVAAVLTELYQRVLACRTHNGHGGGGLARNCRASVHRGEAPNRFVAARCKSRLVPVVRLRILMPHHRLVWVRAALLCVGFRDGADVAHASCGGRAAAQPDFGC